MRRSFTRFTPASSIAWISGTRLEARSPTSSQGAGLAANQPVIGICSAAAFAAMKPRSDDRSIKIWDYQTKQCSGCLLPQVHRAVLGVLVPVYVQAALDATSIRHGEEGWEDRCSSCVPGRCIQTLTGHTNNVSYATWPGIVLRSTIFSIPEACHKGHLRVMPTAEALFHPALPIILTGSEDELKGMLICSGQSYMFLSTRL